MTKLKTISSFLEREFPILKAESWDKTGLHYGSDSKVIKKVLVTLDLTKETYDHAVKHQADLIITHHPFRWEETLEEDIKKAPYKLKIHNRLLNSGISVYSLHTNYDSSPKGTSFMVAKKLGFDNISKIKTSKFSAIVEYDSSLEELNENIRSRLKLDSQIQFNFLKDKNVKRVAILAGSGDIEEILELKNNGIRTIITSDVKWSEALTIKDEKINLITVPHNIEEVFVENIKQILNEKFDSVISII